MIMAQQPREDKRRILVKVTDMDTGRELATHTIEHAIALCCSCSSCSSSNDSHSTRT
jgi:hypothetical protein